MIKRIAAIALSAALLGGLTACGKNDIDDLSLTEYDYGGAFDFGNTPGNIVNKGLAAFDGEWVYHSDPADGYRLRKMRKDGSENQVLSREECININVSDGVIYFTCVSFNDYAYRIYPDGTGEDDYPGYDTSYLTVPGDGWLYYYEDFGVKRRLISNYRDNMEPGEFHVDYLSHGLRGEMNVADGKVFYIDKDNNSLYSMDTDGGNVRWITDERCAYINAVGGWIYYSGVKENHAIFKMRYDGTDKISLTEDRAEHINVSGDGIYYSNYAAGENGALWKMRADGSEKTKISGDKCRYINVIGNVIFYSNTNDGDALYMITTDGNGRRRVNGKTAPEPAAVVPDYGAAPQTVNNGAGNAANRGYAAFDGEWIYFHGDNGYLHKCRPDGSGITPLNGEVSDYISLYDDRIYYASDNAILVIRPDGTERTTLCSANVRNMSVTEDGIFFLEAEGKGDVLYRINHDGTGKTQISDGVAEMYVYNGMIYFRYYNGDLSEYGGYWSPGAIGRMHLDGSGKEKLDDAEVVESFCVLGDYIYLSVEIESGMADRRVFKMKTDGSDVMVLNDMTTGWAMDLYINADDDGWIYYSGFEVNGVFGLGTSCPLYKIKNDGTGRTLLDDEYSRYYSINTAGDWIICEAWEGLYDGIEEYDGYNEYTYYIIMVRKDGSEKRVLGSRIVRVEIDPILRG
jgi:hypothetical protein